jgi:alkylation response protein AidB-like acyl-CoA dehydrogenase
VGRTLRRHRSPAPGSGSPADPELRLSGTVRFCSGARTIDRALVVADAPGPEPWDGTVLVNIAVTQPGVRADPATWGDVSVHWLGLPDFALDEHADALRQTLEPLLADADAYLAPWPGPAP